MKRLTCVVFSAALWMLAPTIAHGAAFTNGSFEMPGGLSPSSFIYLPRGDTTLSGWSIGGSGGPVEYVNNALVCNGTR